MISPARWIQVGIWWSAVMLLSPYAPGSTDMLEWWMLLVLMAYQICFHLACDWGSAVLLVWERRRGRR